MRLERIAPLSAEPEPLSLVWADLLGQARVNAGTAVRYFAFMAVAGMIAGFGVIDPEPDPDRRGDGRESRPAADHGGLHGPCCSAYSSLHAGIGRARGWGWGSGWDGVRGHRDAACLTLPMTLQAQSILYQTHVNSQTILVAMAAGVAGMMALETRERVSRVAISVTTIPASAFLGVAAGIGQLSKSLEALVVLGTNVVVMLVGGGERPSSPRGSRLPR